MAKRAEGLVEHLSLVLSPPTQPGRYEATNAPITVVPHPPRLVVGRDYERDLTLAAWPLAGAFALYGELFLYIAHLCSTDLLLL